MSIFTIVFTTNISMYVSMYVCMYVRMCVCMCMYICMYVCMYVCVYLSIFLSIRPSIHPCMYHNIHRRSYQDPHIIDWGSRWNALGVSHLVIKWQSGYDWFAYDWSHAVDMCSWGILVLNVMLNECVCKHESSVGMYVFMYACICI